jgi:hypothetical protein
MSGNIFPSEGFLWILFGCISAASSLESSSSSFRFVPAVSTFVTCTSVCELCNSVVIFPDLNSPFFSITSSSYLISFFPCWFHLSSADASSRSFVLFPAPSIICSPMILLTLAIALSISSNSSTGCSLFPLVFSKQYVSSKLCALVILS